MEKHSGKSKDQKVVCGSNSVTSKGHLRNNDSETIVCKNRFETLSQWDEQCIERICNEINVKQLCDKKQKLGQMTFLLTTLVKMNWEKAHCATKQG